MFYAPVATFESLEERRLLSAAAMNATGTFSGVLKLRTPDAAGRRSEIVTLEVASQDAGGQIAGTLDGAVFGNTTFSGGQVGAAAGKGGVPLAFNFSGGQNGSVNAKLDTRTDSRITGTVKDAAGKKLGTIRLNRTVDTAVATTAGAGNDTSTSTSTSTMTGTTTTTTGTTVSHSGTATNTGTVLPPLFGPGVVNQSAPDGSVNVTSGSPDISTAGGGGVGSGIDISTANGAPNGPVSGPDGSVNVTSGSPDISTAGGGGIGSGIDISTANGSPNGPVSGPDGSVNVTSGSPDISIAGGGGIGSGIDISTANGGVNGLSINSPSTLVDTSSTGAAGTTAATTLFNTGTVITNATRITTTSSTGTTTTTNGETMLTTMMNEG